MKKHFTYSVQKQIWRILISDSDKLILETRDTSTREVFFNCFDLQTGKKIFTDLQLEEKSWLGIEAIHRDVIFFHKYFKPDMPGHKEIIAFDIQSQKILWHNTDYTFLFAYNGKVYCYKQGFEERYFAALDYQNGNLIEELGSDYQTINLLKTKADNEVCWSLYVYPQVLHSADGKILEIIQSKTANLAIAGDIEYNTYKDLLLFSYNVKAFENSYINKFCVVDMPSGKEVLSEILNVNSGSLYTDSFFVYKKFLFLLKEKNGVIIFTLD
ncbi:MAG: DUF4905 domain-containing protein [Ignavibacteriales bacterium]|nr:DUF4905 domain-containing protein [Ignavibacteriales bacterium]